ncbi:MAG: nucleotidyl transferase AbiEii/AbiGii toxin family protein [Jatrophihabitantaceae bacterium]
MTSPNSLDPSEAAMTAEKFGVALEQVRRDHLISHILAALQTHADDLIFFGGTALARTHLPEGRLSEDIDLISISDRRVVATNISRRIERALLVSHGRIRWTVPLADLRDTEPATLLTDDGLAVRIQLLKADGYPPWPTEQRQIHQRYKDIPPTRLRVPTRDAFAAAKTAAWFDRHTPRDLYDLWTLAQIGALTPAAADLFAKHSGIGRPQDHMFTTGPTSAQWQQQLAGQTRLTNTADEALRVVRAAWAATAT